MHTNVFVVLFRNFRFYNKIFCWIYSFLDEYELCFNPTICI